MNIHLSLRLLPLLAMLAATGCKPKTAAPEPPPPPKVTVTKPVTEIIQDYREYTGYIDAVDAVNVQARVRGRLLSVNFQEGSEVKKGDLLYTIDPAEFKANVAKAEADFAKAKAESARADADEARARAILSTRAISDEEYRQRLTARESAAASVKQYQAALDLAHLDLGYTEIKAEIDGKVSRSLVTKGNLVGYNEPTLLTTIVRMDKVYVYFDIPENHMLQYAQAAKKNGWPAATDDKVPIYVGVGNEKGFTHQGIIDFQDNRVDTGSGTIRIRGLLENPGHVLTPGLFARVRVPIGQPEPRLMIPEVALMSDQRGRFIYVVKPDNTVDYRPVVIGSRRGTLIAINQGLKEGESVIINGLQRVRPNIEVNPELAKTPPAKEVAKEKAPLKEPETPSLPKTPGKEVAPAGAGTGKDSASPKK
jgi:RND family efflux transporter MFP subunit